MFKYNRDIERRQELLGLPAETVEYDFEKRTGWFGGTYCIDNVNVRLLKQLLDEKFIDPNENQNYSPNTLEFYDFLKKHPNFTVFGYAVSSDRDDYRVTIEGITCKNVTSDKDLLDFSNMFHDADEFEVAKTYCRAWYD